MIETNELSKNAKGGTELMLQRLHDSMPEDLLNNFQIIPSRVRKLDETKYRILWIHDLDGDTEAVSALSNSGWKNFHLIVFVSNWQAQRFIEKFSIPWSKCLILQNAIEPIQVDVRKPTDKIKLIYHTTPHRGLNILLAVFDAIAKKYENIELDVYSSFAIYGRQGADKHYENLYDFCRNHEKINYHGSVSNEEVREALKSAHIFAYPSIWPETSCLALMEAMSAGCLCVHPNLAALFETAANWTHMYHFHEDIQEHARIFGSVLDNAVSSFKADNVDNLYVKLSGQKSYVDIFYNWNLRKPQWETVLKSILSKNETRGLPKEEFFYKV